MQTLINWYLLHPIFYTVTLGYLWSSFISALPSPTAQSGQFYLFAFKFLNVLAANISRASNSSVERSPNFQDAVNALPGPKNKPVVVVEAPKP